MSDISSGSIDINLHTGDDGSGRGPDGDMKVVVETLRNVQNSVATISQNVRAILDTLRAIARTGGMARERAATASATAAVQPQRVTVIRRPAYDPRKALAIRGGVPDFAWVSSGAVSSPLADELERRRASQNAPRSLMLPGGGGALALLDSINQQRQAQGLARVSRMNQQPGTAMFSLGPGIGITRLRPIPLLPSGGLSGGALAVAAQSGAGGGIPGGPGMPPVPPPPPPPQPASSGIGWGQGFRSIGRILATLSLIGSAIKTIISLVKYLPDLAKQQRAELARVDPVIAQYEAQAMIASLRDKILMARDPGVRSAYAGFTQSQMGFLESTRQIRSDTRKGVANLGGLIYDRLGGYGLMYEGFKEMFSDPLSGLAKILIGHDVFNPLSGFGGNYRQYMAARLAGQANTIRSLFIGDLAGMTGGRFSTSVAYPGRQAGEAWWNARP
jgi:hypothetical protein